MRVLEVTLVSDEGYPKVFRVLLQTETSEYFPPHIMVHSIGRITAIALYAKDELAAYQQAHRLVRRE